MDEFNYNVPLITDFTDDCNNVDSYFDQMTETVGQLQISENYDKDEVFYSPTVETSIPKKNPKSLPRSSSVGDLKKILSCGQVGVQSNNTNLKRALSKDSIYKKTQAKLNNGVQHKFVSMAEAINRFQKATPVRFRTKIKDTGPLKGPSKPTATIPHSPALLTSKLRHRPHKILSTEEKELLEFEEAQKFKIKAHPVNHKVLKGPIKPENPVAVKPKTVPEPFKLTAPLKTEKKPEPEVKKTEFHAKPVPKSLYMPPKVVKQSSSATMPMTPTFMKNQPKTNKMQRATSDQQINKQSTALHSTKIEPFTFEHKYDIIKKKKDELIKKVFEEEKKAREFHARPIPKLYQKIRVSNMTTCSSQKSEDCLGEPHFKARPALVLKKEPFVPKKSDKPLVEVTDFHLNTDKRAHEREQFEMYLREKEEQLEQFKKEQEIKRKLEEMREIQRLRKEAEHVAQPIRKYKEVEIKPSNKVTKPISPKFLSGRRNKENEHTVN